ncbi:MULTISPECIES: tRNA cyclic N6-threonylcarbamoyladenosine(37) synthase TcdA [unclassified Gilliamella]|uniref:tRNA cyclic N6-threonylcarbamoyladenosine(37) synthase TcdA n=1 Tax=unclassified Gilliamella TaxID=2685620 RepID=UPI00080DD5DE|nr:tRNA cyclic N6-threonylcarbamoyladenosine(37) synthase TcdA [Gilliamella apicola]MCO6555476.1 tRNA cyclic N6-threonylcarbamoyladenosine(37) synthase TcdA [Gilliamella sp.]MCO6557663.1 tRNA cyclic N6-threonylcarbamoyladenosine(37) synthase TcdA [Gilliamella sp.]OCG38138.1 tRNA cyclic N6-threonylcarbamoyladenosine(37) synthase TcdA [Gilliamella apicola]OCG49088.1 tRNA cyclic N6-threonylcarbamoyladenosine(37) synthase TcdA [Gilliamella apicola]OCG49921.1 tRNA cyclic N6-threonylcarbamoyladenosi
MNKESYFQRFSGIARLYGESALQCFSQAHICVIGIGGVGSWVAESLARSGIGQITLIDMDDVCVTNTNRQIHALKSNIGKAKTSVMAERILQINPECIVNEIDDFINSDNVSEYLGTKQSPCYHYIIEAIDSVHDKAAVLAYCKRQKLKVITIGGAGGQKDPTQIKIADLAKTIQDPLVAKLREKLKYNYKLNKDSKGKYGIPCVFSTEQLTYPSKNGQVCLTKSEADGPKKMDCESGFGAITTVTATFGFVAVSYVLNKLCNT